MTMLFGGANQVNIGKENLLLYSVITRKVYCGVDRNMIAISPSC
jgi:hypothetical protein